MANAVSRSDQFDFLIDIVPREEPPKPSHKKSSTREDVAPEVRPTGTVCLGANGALLLRNWL